MSIDLTPEQRHHQQRSTLLRLVPNTTGLSPNPGFGSSSLNEEDNQLTESAISLKVTDKVRQFGKMTCDCESFLLSGQKRNKDGTQGSTEGASSCVSQLEKFNLQLAKASYFSRGPKLTQENSTSAELKIGNCPLDDSEEDHAHSFVQARQPACPKKASCQSDSESCDDSECSGIELSLENSSDSSSKNSSSFNCQNEVKPLKAKEKVKGDLRLDEPNFSDSSSCNFSFEYLHDDDMEEGAGPVGHPPALDHQVIDQLASIRSVCTAQPLLQTGSRGHCSSMSQTGKPAVNCTNKKPSEKVKNISKSFLFLVLNLQSKQVGCPSPPSENHHKSISCPISPGRC